MKISRGNKIITAAVSCAAILGLGVGAAQVSHADALPAVGQSNAHVKVTTNTLSLLQVPDFNFGEAANSTSTQNSLPLVNNDDTKDGRNGKAIIEVSDSRTGKTPGDQTGQGWNLTAGLGNFSDAKNNSVDGFAMNLTSNDISNRSGSVIPALSKATLNAGAGSSTVINAAPGTGYGTTIAGFGTPKDANLNMPANVAPADYNAPITWTLSANAAS